MFGIQIQGLYSHVPPHQGFRFRIRLFCWELLHYTHFTLADDLEIQAHVIYINIYLLKLIFLQIVCAT
jgi:hypothetical protein